MAWRGRRRAALKLLPVERARPVLLHGPLGALELRERFGVEDELVLHAIRWHTPGHPDFGPEAWAMFVADKVEPAKLARRPELQRVIDLAADSLQAAALAYLELEAARSEREDFTLHPLRDRDAGGADGGPEPPLIGGARDPIGRTRVNRTRT